MPSLHDLPIGKKLAALLLLFILGLAAYIGFVFQTALAMRSNSQQARNAYPLLLQVSETGRFTTEMRDLYTVAVTSQDADMLEAARQQSQRVQLHADKLAADAARDNVALPGLVPAFSAYARAADAWAGATVEGSGTPAQAQASLFELSQRQQAFTQALDGSREAINASFAAHLREIEASADRTWRFGLFGGIALSVMMLVLNSLLSRRMIVQPLRDALAATDRIAAGDWEKAVPVHGRDELGQLLGGIETLRQQLHARRETDRRNEFVTTVLADLNLQMRGDLDTVELCERVMRFLTPTVGCAIGLLYLNEGHQLRPAAAYALCIDPLEPVPRGHSLVGQVAQSGQPVLLREVPDSYLHSIRSGSAGLRPRHVAILPVHHDDELLAVLELGALAPFEDDLLELINRCSEHFAVLLKVAQSRQRTVAPRQAQAALAT
ncbi:MAG: sensor histidine kinase/respose regulator [Moraxellaceae bacterium]|jgi:HAMP domain-containing protein|nr:sensor histidine kinase/respose regulator [Moraxellaceae bacterium]